MLSLTKPSAQVKPRAGFSVRAMAGLPYAGHSRQGRKGGSISTNDTPKTDVSIPLGRLEEGILADRPNRFLAVVDLAGRAIKAHVPDSGRLRELLFPGNRVMVRKAASPTRKTSYDLVLAASGGTESGGEASGGIWVCVDTRYPNRIFEQGVKQRALDAFREYTSVRREVRLEQALTQALERTEDAVVDSKAKASEAPTRASKTPKSRFDFLLEGPGKRPLLIEVKSVTLSVDGTGLFPDAPTLRGARHVSEMKEALSRGLDACVAFIAQRQDVIRVSAHRQMDPKFAQALDEATRAGVKVHAYRCEVTPAHIRLESAEVPYR